MAQTPEEYQAGIDRTREAVNDAEAHSPVPDQKPVIPKDDNPGANPSSAQKQVEVNAAQSSNKVTPQPNVLDQYASYTYNIGLYMLTQDQFNALGKSNRPSVADWSLLIQSGGASVSKDSPNTPGRNPHFGLDYVIDELEFSTAYPGKGTGNSTTVGEMKFKVFEANGLTLVPNLIRAAEEVYKDEEVNRQGGRIGSDIIFAIVIRFYGYDDAGNLVQCGKRGSTTGKTSPSDPNAIIEKIYPIAVSEMDFTVNGRMVEYQFKSTVRTVQIAQGSQRGTIPHAFQVTGHTLEQILSSTSQPAQDANADDGRIDQPLPPNPPSVPDSGYEALDYDSERNSVIDY